MPTVPFKYAQSFKDIFASFTGSPKLLLTSADFEGMWSHMLPLLAAPPHSTPSPSLDTPHQAVVTVFADQGGLPEKEFLTFVAEVFQVVSANNAALTYDALAWVMVEGLVERQFFAETGALAGLEVQASADGATTVDLKEIRLVLDPHIRAVRLDVGTLYTAECGSSERIDRRRLMNVLRAVFGATTPNFGLLMKWSRATKPVARGRPSVVGAPAAGVAPSSVSSTPTDLRSVLRPVGSTGGAAAAAATSIPSTSSSTSKPAAESASSMFGVTLRTTAGPPAGVGGDKTPRTGTPVAAEAPSSFALAPTAAAASSSSSAPPSPPPAAASSPQLDESTTLANSMTVATAEEPSSPPAVTENKPAEPTARNSSSITFEIPTVVVAASEPERSPTPPSQQSAAAEQARSASPSLPPPPPPPPPPRPMTPPRVKPEAPPAAAARTAPPPQQPQQQQQQQQEPQQQPLLRDPPPLPDAVRQALQRHQQQQAQLHASTLSAHKQQQQQQQQPSSYSLNPSGNRYAAAAAPSVSSPSRDELLRCAATSTTTATLSNVLMGRSAVSLMGLRHAQDLPPEVLSFVTALDQQRTTLQQMLEEELTQLTTGQQTLQMLQQRRASLQHAQQHPLYLTLEGERTELLHRMEQWVQKHNARQHAAQVEVQKVQRDRLMRQVEETQAYHSLLPPTSTAAAVPAPQVAGMPGYTHPSLPRYVDPIATTVPTTTTTVELPSAVAVQALQIVSDPTPRLAAFFEAMSGHEEQIAHRQAALRKLHQLSKKEDKIRAEMADLEQQQQQLSPRQDRFRSLSYGETAAVGGHSDFPQPQKEGTAAAGRRDTPTDRTVNTILMPQGSPSRHLQSSSSSASSPLQKTVTVQQHEELILKKLEQYLSKKATSIS